MKPSLNKLPRQVLPMLIGLAAALSTACGGNAGKTPETLADGVAMFDFFDYAGNDTFYTENALPDASSVYNPILPGWYSDPSICTNGKGDYFLVTSTFTYFPGVPIFHSRDLVNWKQIGHVLDRPSQLVNMGRQHISGGIFAPAISYNPANATYYMVTTNVGAGNFFVKTQDPFGSWSDPIMLPEVGGIDPSFFFDDNGKAYIVNNDDAPNGKAEYPGHRTIRVQEFDVTADKTVGPRKILVNKGVHPEDKPIWIEGPHMYKINGNYFLMDAEGGTSDWHSEVIFRSDSPWGPFVPAKQNPILTQRHLDRSRPNPVTCAGHADLVQTPEGDWWCVFLACRPIGDGYENLGRETFLMPVRWTEEGFPLITEGDEVVPMIVRREGVVRGEETTFGNFSKHEDFSAPQLGMEWMSLRAPATEFYSLEQEPGYLALTCAERAASERTTPAFVCRRMQHHEFEAATRMFFEPKDRLEAGVLLFKDERHHYFFNVQLLNDEPMICVKRIDQNGTSILASEEVGDAKRFDMKVVSKGTTYDFLYSLDGGKAWKTLASEVPAKFLSTAVAGGFTGSTIGLYATCSQ